LGVNTFKPYLAQQVAAHIHSSSRLPWLLA